MKAIYMKEHGSSDVLEYGELPEPSITEGQIKVRVRSCSLNRLDIFTRLGVRGTRIDFNGPHVLGGDLSGDVVETGNQVTRVKVGDRVVINPKSVCRQCDQCLNADDELCAKPNMLGSTMNGGYAEFVVTPGSTAVKIPDHISYTEAAGIPTVFLPAWSILIRRGALKPWETVLVVSSSSGVGSAALQVAKNVVGATVIATTSSKQKSEISKTLGADEVLNYNSEDVIERIKVITKGKGVDVVIDHVGTDAWAYALPSLARGGRYGICGVTSGYKAELQMGSLFLKNQTIFGSFMGKMADLPRIVELVARGVLKPKVHETFSLRDAAKAHDLMESREFFGKIILEVE